MKRFVLMIGCIVSIFVLLIIPSVSAVEYDIAKQSVVSPNIFNIFKEKLESSGCPATLILLLWEIVCGVALIIVRTTLNTKPLAFATSYAFILAAFYRGVLAIGEYFTDTDVTYFSERPPHDQLVLIVLFSMYILYLAIMKAIRNGLMSV